MAKRGHLNQQISTQILGAWGVQLRRWNRREINLIPAETIPKDLSMTARGRFQQNVDAVQATEKDLWGYMGELPRFHEDRIQGWTGNGHGTEK